MTKFSPTPSPAPSALAHGQALPGKKQGPAAAGEIHPGPPSPGPLPYPAPCTHRSPSAPSPGRWLRGVTPEAGSQHPSERWWATHATGWRMRRHLREYHYTAPTTLVLIRGTGSMLLCPRAHPPSAAGSRAQSPFLSDRTATCEHTAPWCAETAVVGCLAALLWQREWSACPGSSAVHGRNCRVGAHLCPSSKAVDTESGVLAGHPRWSKHRQAPCRPRPWVRA